MRTAFLSDFVVYVSRFREFGSDDWRVYFVWIGLMVGLVLSVTGFLVMGTIDGVRFPAYVWNVPLGTLIFAGAISVDTIGHRTIYKQALSRAESLVHHITIAAGISSVVLLCLAHQYREFLMIPAYCMTGLSVFYSVIDEAMHWFRFYEGNSDRVEMWSHFFIFVGHTIMMASWVYWFAEGYPGVDLTLKSIGW